MMVRLFTVCFLLVTTLISVNAQDTPSSDERAVINGTISNFEGNAEVGETILFVNTSSNEVFETISDENGAFHIKLPFSATYQIKIKGFSEDQDYSEFTVPTLKEGQTGLTFKIDIQFQPARVFTLRSVHFDTGKATLTKESYAELEKLLDFLKLKKNKRIEIGGHTDSIGKAEDNLILSQKRAEAVKAYLVSRGIRSERIIAKGYGENKPIGDNGTAMGRKSNRRTEVEVLED